jgi:GT2 family glycosyltransferase
LIFSSVVLFDLLYHDVVTDEFVLQDFSFVANKQGETWERVTQIRDKFEYDRERKIRERGKDNACWCSAGYFLHDLSCIKITIYKLSDIMHFQLLPFATPIEWMHHICNKYFMLNGLSGFRN